MGRALEVLSGRVTAPGVTLTALTMAAGNVLTIRNAPLESDVRLLDTWVDAQVAGVMRIRSPRLHDNVQGIRFDTIVSEVQPLLPPGAAQRLYAQDTLTVELSGSAVGGDFEIWGGLIYYDNLPGVEARLARWDDIARRIVHIVTNENPITAGAGGGYTGEAALNATFDLLKANTDYALLGYVVDAECAVVRWRGPDTGNFGVGGPGADNLRHVTRNWFVSLANAAGVPTIPIINSANKAGTLVDVAQDENATAVVVTSILAELGPAPAPGR